MPSSLLTPSRQKEAGAARERGITWLLEQQAADGGWHSSTYGGLRDGAAVTSLAVYTFSLMPDQDRPALKDSVEAAAEFLRKGFLKRRTIASPDGSLDYPTYAAAMVLTASRRFPSLSKALPPEQLVEYLIGAQVNVARGFKQDSPDYGGWDLLGIDDASGVSTGTNVSVTNYALEALATELSPEVKAARQLGLAWLLRAQHATGDGGFAFTAEGGSINNKALWRDAEHQHPHSYGSPTCDGIRGLLHCGLTKDEKALQAALKWVIDHPAVEFVPGFEDVPAQLGWRDGLRFYYAQSLARVLNLLPQGVAEDRAERLVNWLLRVQAGSSWRNESARMREDDPLIATSFAVTALGQLA